MRRIAEKFANEGYDKDVMEAAICLNTPESAEVLSFVTGGSHWALKRNNPTVTFPLPISNILRTYYNEQNPHCSPDDAAARLAALPQYSKSLYVRYVMDANKIKAFFSTLKAKKVNGVVPEQGEVTEAAEGYKQWITVGDMKQEYSRRVAAGTMKKLLRQPNNKYGWAMALELNDMQLSSVITNNMEEIVHAEGVADGIAEDSVDGELDREGDLDAEAENLDPEAAPSDAHLEHDLLGDDSK